MSLKSKTLIPGLLVGLSTNIKGDNVTYDKTVIEEEHVDELGQLVGSWQTDKTVADAAEYELAKKIRGRARTLITSICAKSDFGYLCPEAKQSELEAAIRQATEICDDFNLTARITEVNVYTITGRIAATDEQAARAIKGELNNLLEAMDAATQKFDVKAIREFRAKAQKLGQMLTPDVRKSLDEALDERRTLATKINKAIKAGEEASKELDAQTLAALARSRTAFLDLDGETEVRDTEAVARALDLDPDVEASAEYVTNARELELDPELEEMLS
jgi:hypothetical protein